MNMEFGVDHQPKQTKKKFDKTLPWPKFFIEHT